MKTFFKRPLYLIILLYSLTSCDSPVEKEKITTDPGPYYQVIEEAIDQQDYDLYTQAILYRYNSKDDIRISDITMELNTEAMLNTFEAVKYYHPDADYEWFYNFVDASKDKYLIDDHFSENDNHTQISIITESYLETIRNNPKKYWDKLHDAYPSLDGYIKFSPIAYNSDATKAFFMMNMFCGNLCAHGDIIVFEKQNNSWVIVNFIEVWVS